MRDRYKVLSEKYQLVTEQTEEPVMKVDEYGTKEWRLNGKLHRTDGPAVEFPDGSKLWKLNGKLHRTDGPAFEGADGTKYWYLNGVKYTEEKWKEQMKLEQGLKDLALIRIKFK